MKTTLTFLLTAIMLLTPVLELRADDTPYDGREADTVLIFGTKTEKFTDR